MHLLGASMPFRHAAAPAPPLPCPPSPQADEHHFFWGRSQQARQRVRASLRPRPSLRRRPPAAPVSQPAPPGPPDDAPLRPGLQVVSESQLVCSCETTQEVMEAVQRGAQRFGATDASMAAARWARRRGGGARCRDGAGCWEGACRCDLGRSRCRCCLWGAPALGALPGRSILGSASAAGQAASCSPSLPACPPPSQAVPEPGGRG